MTYEDIVRFGGDCEVHSLRSQVVLRNCWRSCRCRRNQRVHRYEQRGAGCQEEDHDDCRSMYLPRGSSTGIAIVLRCDQLTSESYSVHIQ